MILYRIITNKWVAGVEVGNNTILNTAPILRKFKGQNIENLKKWVKQIGGQIERIA